MDNAKMDRRQFLVCAAAATTAAEPPPATTAEPHLPTEDPDDVNFTKNY